MKLCWVTLHVSDMKKSLEFYQDLLGLEISNQIKVSDDFEIVFLGGEAAVKIELIYEKNKAIKKNDHSF